jgi:hypothetical protein
MSKLQRPISRPPPIPIIYGFNSSLKFQEKRNSASAVNDDEVKFNDAKNSNIINI